MDRCAICEGTQEEHKNSIHAFTLTPGELKSPADVAKEKPQPVPFVMPARGLDPSMARLLTLLKSKDILDLNEVLHVITGEEVPADGS